jgi:hypothetical protein
MRVPLETSSLFDLLLRKILEEGKNEFKIEEYTFFFRYSTVKVGTILKEEVQIPKLDKNVAVQDVLSLVCDVTGLDDSYITQIEVTRTDLYVIPRRPTEKIESFKKIAVTY